MKRFIKSMTISSDKLGNRKELKQIVCADLSDFYALKVIDSYFVSFSLQDAKANTSIIQSLFISLKPEFDHLEFIEKQGIFVNEQYDEISYNIVNLLKVLYPQTIDFLSKLLYSH